MWFLSSLVLIGVSARSRTHGLLYPVAGATEKKAIHTWLLTTNEFLEFQILIDLFKPRHFEQGWRFTQRSEFFAAHQGNFHMSFPGKNRVFRGQFGPFHLRCCFISWKLLFILHLQLGSSHVFWFVFYHHSPGVL